ncbi:protein Wnt-4-like [Watersipora subatra]|uniref:protein Wnt-4-like n=1 Tax=Watersipora subatra TaxID=2589382 RepID=UPI00355BDF74
MDYYQLTILITIILGMLNRSEAQWWYLGVVGPYTATEYGIEQKPKEARSKRAQPCEDMPFLGARQKELCNQGEFIIDVISEGAAMAISECLIQFKDRRWNCSTFDTTDVFGKILTLGVKEKSFVYSITSGGVMHAVTNACARGEIGNCGCDTSVYNRDTKNQFQWGGCSHNPDFGARFAREFVDSKNADEPSETKMNLWNNEAGRQMVKKEMKTLCKCHGVSASCAIKICWRSLAGFNEVGDALKISYDGAKEVKYNPRRDVLKPAQKHYAKPTKQDLVYFSESPNFCDYDPSVGSLGTAGRACNRTSQGLDSCSLLCCGRGFYSQVKDVEEDCNCKFVWCCTVECDKCRRKQEFNYCK